MCHTLTLTFTPTHKYTTSWDAVGSLHCFFLRAFGTLLGTVVRQGTLYTYHKLKGLLCYCWFIQNVSCLIETVLYCQSANISHTV